MKWQELMDNQENTKPWYKSYQQKKSFQRFEANNLWDIIV